MDNPNPSDDKRADIILEEYRCVRAELLLRMQLRHRTMLYCIIFFGVLMSLGLSESNAAVVLLCFPFFALAMAINWSYVDLGMAKIGAYIKDCIEPKLPDLQWEQRVFEERCERSNQRKLFIFHRTSELAAFAIFGGCSFLSIIVGAYRMENFEQRHQLLLICAASLCAIGTFFVIRTRALFYERQMIGR